MGDMVMRAMLAVLSVALAAPAAAASLLTTSAGYTGPTLVLPSDPFVNSVGPIALAGGITLTSTSEFSVIGTGSYGLDVNGFTNATPIIGTNDGASVVTLTFDTAVASFGGGFNYAVQLGGSVYGNPPTIAAFDESNNLIASYDLFALAPISTPGVTDVFQFRGIDGRGSLIKSFTLSGSFIVMSGIAGSAVPEPATWVMLITGFALVGAAARRRVAIAA
jgi:hypothetical protein